MKCPKCQSENTQRLEVAYHSGTQNILTSSNSTGIGFSGGRIGVAGAVTTTSGRTQTALAVACSPPEQKPTVSPMLGVVIVFVFGMSLMWHWIFSLAWLAFGTIVVRRHLAHTRYNKTEWPQLHQTWSESWICHRCGNIYHQV